MARLGHAIVQLLLVLEISIFLNSADALQCYTCNSADFADSNPRVAKVCREATPRVRTNGAPGPDSIENYVRTCAANMNGCSINKTEIPGQQSLVIRGCINIGGLSLSECKILNNNNTNTKTSVCVCAEDKCNMAPGRLTFGSLPPVILVIFTGLTLSYSIGVPYPIVG